jgi:benzaldehyde dehydrogenase (NAD)
MGAPEALRLIDAAASRGRVFDNGQWRSPRGGARDAIEPATGAALFSAGIANADDMWEAIVHAHAAQVAWAATGARERAAVLLRAAQILEAHFDELALAIARETGGIVPKEIGRAHV